MLYQWKVLIVVIVLTTVSFMVARPVMCRFMSAADFAVRRNVWLGINTAAFLIPNYWAYVLAASLFFVYGVKRDSNPAALYVFLLLAMTPVGLNLPTLGVIKKLFVLNHFRLLALVLLVPLAWMHWRGKSAHAKALPVANPANPADRAIRAADVLILAYAALQLVLLMPYESSTASLRRLLLLALDMLLPYYVLSRTCRTREALTDVMAAFTLSLFLLVPLAAYEVARHSLLYPVLQETWGTGQVLNYLERAGYLRAQVTAGHSIVLGYAMAMAMGFWLYLQSQVPARGWRLLGFAGLIVGLALTLARGPWLGALLVVFVFLVLSPNAFTRLVKASGWLLALAIVSLVSPFGKTIIASLPFIGTLDEGTIDYRKQLAEQSWRLIQLNPLFGTPSYLTYLEDLRQGQGIIDMVNAYASIALSFGLVSLFVFLSFFLIIIWRCIKAMWALSIRDTDMNLMGASIVASMVGGLAMIATVNLYLSIAPFTWALAGLATAFLVVAREELRDELAVLPDGGAVADLQASSLGR